MTGSLTGASGALFVGDATDAGRFLGFALFGLSNLAFAWWTARNRFWWVFALQFWYTLTTIRGLINNW